LGQGLSVIGEPLEKIEYQDDKLQAEDGINRLHQRKMNLTSGEDGFSNVKSGNVVKRPLYKEYIEQFDESVSEISNNLKNDQQRNFFQRRAEVLKLQYGGDLTNHIQREKNTHAKQVYEGGKVIELQNAAAHWNEPASVALSLERTKNLIDQQGEREGWGKDILKAQKLAATSDVHQSVISQAIATDNPEYAKEWYKKNKKSIDATQYPKIESLIREGGIKVLAQEVADDIQARGLDEKTAMAEIRKKYKGDEENAILQSVKNRFHEANRIQDENERAAGEEAWNTYASTGDFDQIPLTADASGRKIPNGGPGYYELKQMAANDPTAFKNANPFAYGMSDTDRVKIIDMQTKPEKIQLFGSDTSIVSRAAFEAGLDTTQLSKTGTKGDNLRKFHERVRQEQESYQIANGRPTDDKTLQEIADRLAIKVIRERSFWFDAEEPAGIIEIEGVPTEIIDELASAVKRVGEPVTQENILKLYRHKYGR
jgi:hypothetical protein